MNLAVKLEGKLQISNQANAESAREAPPPTSAISSPTCSSFCVWLQDEGLAKVKGHGGATSRPGLLGGALRGKQVPGVRDMAVAGLTDEGANGGLSESTEQRDVARVLVRRARPRLCCFFLFFTRRFISHLLQVLQ